MDGSRPSTRLAPPLNRKYLRAIHDHDQAPPPNDFGQYDTKTVTLRKGDLVLVHLTDANGWVDGTVLNSGDRGWIPAEYCEPYDHEYVRIFFHGLTELWSAGVRDSEVTSWRTTRQEEVQVLVTGIRYVLDKTRCLRRNDSVVKSCTLLQATRKNLLAELSALVKTNQHVAGQAITKISAQDWNILTNEYTRRAFSVSVRLVRFMDVWQQYITDPETEIATTPEDERPPSRCTLPPPKEHGYHNKPSRSNSVSSAKQRFSSLASLGRKGQSRTSPVELPAGNNRFGSIPALHKLMSSKSSPNKVSSVKCATPTSMNGHVRSKSSETTSRISDLLTVTQSRFFDHIGAFLSLQLQADTPEETKALILATLESSATLMALLRDIRSRDTTPADGFDSSIQTLSDDLAVLRNAIHSDTRRDSKQSTVSLDASTSTPVLMPIATACIRSAAACVSVARKSLLHKGDYTLDPRALLLSVSAQNENIEAPPAVSSCPPKPNVRPRLRLQTQSTSPDLTLFPRQDTSARPLTAPDTNGLHREALHRDDGPMPKAARSMLSPQPSTAMTKTSFSSGLSDLDSWRKSPMSAPSCASTRATTPDIMTPLPASAVNLSPVSGTATGSTGQLFAHEVIIATDGQLVGGTPRALVEYLVYQTSDGQQHPTKPFLLTFNQFMTAMDLASALVTQYKILEKKAEPHLVQQDRVLQLMTDWLDTYWDTEANATALEKLLHFATSPQFHMSRSSRHDLLDAIRTVQTRRDLVASLQTSEGEPTRARDICKTTLPANLTKVLPAVPHKSSSYDVNLVDYPAIELARQLTLMTSWVFNRIGAQELLAAGLSRSSSSTPNIHAMSVLSTNITHLVSTSIVLASHTRPRAHVLKQWIKIASACLALHNYDTLMAVMCALNSSPITRLYQTWALIPLKHVVALEQLKAICEVTRNFSVLRSHLRDAPLPCLPFMGLFLTDLTFVDAGNPNTRILPIPRPDGTSIEVVNFDKYIRTTKIVETVERFQVPYEELSTVDSLQDWLRLELARATKLAAEDKDSTSGWVWMRSCQIEPRRDRAPERVRSCSPIGQKDKEAHGNSLKQARSGSTLGLVRKLSRIDLRKMLPAEH